MNLIADLHTHTIASGHAYSTLRENAAQAAERGLKILGISDHAPGMPETTTMGYFSNMKVWGRRMLGVRILRGAELNIMNGRGDIDLPAEALGRLDYAIASLHTLTCSSLGAEGNTEAVIAAMAHPVIRCIGHPDDGHFPLDFWKLAAAAKERGIALELNNASLTPVTSRLNGRRNAADMLLACKELGTPVLVNTDSHISDDVGDFAYAQALLSETGFPEELIVNASEKRLSAFLGIDLT